jgi:hypothetical protein
MAWFEQLDLDFGSIQDQFTDLIGEVALWIFCFGTLVNRFDFFQASTLLETANHLEILNLDAMAEQEELEEALAAEEEAEEAEEEVVYHDDRPLSPILKNEEHADKQHSPRRQSEEQSARASVHDDNSRQSPPRHERKTVYATPEKDPWAVDTSIALTPAMPTAEKPTHELDSLDEEGASPCKLDSSYNWDGLENLPVKTAKLHAHTKQTSEPSTAVSGSQQTHTDGAARDQTQQRPQTDGDDQSRQMLKATLASAPAFGTLPKRGAATTNPAGTGAATSGRKVKTLKPKEKVKKELDFWGVSSKKKDNKSKIADNNQKTIDTISASLSGSRAGKSEKEGHAAVPADGFFGAMGLFDDIAYDEEPAVDSHDAARADAEAPKGTNAEAAATGNF